MNYFILFIFIHFRGVLSVISLDNYCNDLRNSPCRFGCMRSARCGDTRTSFKTLNDEERIAILEAHNIFRNDVAGGKYSNNYLPHATDMHVLSYDKEVEFLAGCYIKQCLFREDKVIQSLENVNMGQNLFSHPNKTLIKMDKTFLVKSLESWSKEIRFVTKANAKILFTNYVSMNNPGRIRHLTQVLWSVSEFLGCAKMHTLRVEGWNHFDIICNYKPEGNINGQIMYNVGNQNCRNPNSIYVNLCGKIRPLDNDTYIPPINLNTQDKIFPTKLIGIFCIGIIFTFK